MRWFTDVSVWGEKPDVVQVFNSNNECVDYVPERTCHITDVFRHDYEGGYAGTDYITELSCGHHFIASYDVSPDYCPWCGARVVK